jgi:hypothetical protein
VREGKEISSTNSRRSIDFHMLHIKIAVYRMPREVAWYSVAERSTFLFCLPANMRVMKSQKSKRVIQKIVLAPGHHRAWLFKQQKF